MVQLAPHQIFLCLCENAVKATGLTGFAKRLVGRRECGGVRWSERPLSENVGHVRVIADCLTHWLGKIDGHVGAEIGPGDNLGVSYWLVKRGAIRMYAVEKFASVSIDAACHRLFEAIDREEPTAVAMSDVLTVDGSNPEVLRLEQVTMEEFTPEEPLDFVCSYDVLEHVAPMPVFERIFSLLKPGGRSVHVVDFTGHGPFYNLQRPLDFLTCPDWLWSMFFSRMETTNRVRHSEMVAMAEAAGFSVETHPVRLASSSYLSEIRPHLLPRYRCLSDEDLRVMQCVVVLSKGPR